MSIVSIEDGQLKGTKNSDWFGKPYYSFLGIPYAKPPVGKLRFKAPQPPEPWNGVRDATKDGNDCFRKDIVKQETGGSEDCLFLNVHTPQIPEENIKLPVMLWIHGGAFTCGSGSSIDFGPDYLITEDIVVVTINYRVGLLGFASFSDQSLEVPGNAGLKDQVMALRWVQKNISKFGGDPDNVTIFGESAGGASVHLLVLSPAAKGLFHKAICQSGVATAGWARGQRTAPLVAEALGLDKASEKEIFKILMNYPPKELIDLQDKFSDPILSQSRAIGPVVESFSDNFTFLDREPEQILASGEFASVPLMIGYTSKEGLLYDFFVKLTPGVKQVGSAYKDLIPFNLPPPNDVEFLKYVWDKIVNFYNVSDLAPKKGNDEYYLLLTDVHFFIPINNAIREHVKSTSASTYYYRMSVETNLNALKNICTISCPGACHGDDIGYLFKTLYSPKVRPTSPEDVSIQRFVKLWTTFAKHGNPNPVTKDKLVNVTWLPADKENLHFLDIGDNLTVGVHPEIQRVEFWDTIFEICFPNTKL